MVNFTVDQLRYVFSLFFSFDHDWFMEWVPAIS